jgi:FkbM family methyltransferase
MNRQVLIDKLDLAEALAEGPITNRFFASGLNYLSFQWYKRVVYPLLKKGKLTKTALFFGQQMLVKLPAGSDLYLIGAKTHPSEIRLAKFLIRHLEPGMQFLDIGAHFGYFSLLAANLVGPEGKVISLEASKHMFHILEKNTDQNTQNLSIHAAAGDTDGEITFYDYPLIYSEYNTIEGDQYNNDEWNKNIPVEKTAVKMYSLDTLITEQKIQPKVIKIDVEGAETKVLQGLSKSSKIKPIIIFEYIKAKPQDGLVELISEIADRYKLHLMDADGNVGHVINLEDKDQLSSMMDSENLILRPF